MTKQTAREQERGVEELYSLIKTIIKLFAVAFGTIFTYLQLKDTPLNRIGEVFDGQSLIVIALCLYFMGWVIGAGADTDILRTALGRDPQFARLGAIERLAIGTFGVALLLVFALHSIPIVFQLVLMTFVATNVWTWRVIFNRIKPMIDSTAIEWEQRRDNYSYLRLAIMTDYINGSWQRTRFFALFVFAALQVLVACLDRLGHLGQIIGGLTFFGVSGAILANYATGILFLLWVATSEFWMKLYRIKFYSDMKLIAYMENHVDIQRKSKAPLPPLNLRSTFDFTKSDNRNYA